MDVKMVEISVLTPRKLTIPVPQHLLAEFDRVVDEKDLSAVVTEALTDELKKLRFRLAFKKSLEQAGAYQQGLEAPFYLGRAV